jgi:YD repeat-containing protein
VDYVNYWNGVKTDYTYYSGSFRLHNATTSKGANTLQSIQYVFDDVGNVTGMDVSTTPTVGGTTYNVNHSFVYDQLNRLKTAIATCANDASRRYNQGYNYDLAGNMISKTGLGAFEVTAWDSDGFDRPRIRPETVEYDSVMTGIGERDISYNQENKPTEITFNGGTTTYLTYDGAGNRINVIYQNTIILFAELTIIRFEAFLGILPKSSGLLEKKWYASGAAGLLSEV